MDSSRFVVARMEEFLERCGVEADTLTVHEMNALDRDGYVVLADILGNARLADLRQAFETAFDAAGAPDARRSTGTRHVEALLETSDVFAAVLAHPRPLAAVWHVLGRPFRVLHYSGRDPLPGFGQQGLHTDWPRGPRDPFAAATVLWLLDEFTATSGATRVLPGSHRSSTVLPKSQQAPESRHAGERRVLAPAGSALVLNGHLWHSGTRNRGNAPRRVLQCQFVAADAAVPVMDSSPRFAQGLSTVVRILLGERDVGQPARG